MLATVIRRIVISAVIVAAPLVSGCYAEVQTPAGYDGYDPIYTDDGYVVYYDQGGAPYYYVNNRPVYVQRSSPYYTRYVSHYRSAGPRYNRWYSNRGYRYRGYRGRR